MSQLYIPLKYAELLKGQLKKADARLAYDKLSWIVDADDLLAHSTTEELAAVKKMAGKDLTAKVPGAAKIYTAFKELERRAITKVQLAQANSGSFDPAKIQVYRLKDLTEALKNAVEKTSPRRWIFTKLKDYLFTPVFVNEIKYEPAGRYNDEYVSINCVAVIGKDAPELCTCEFKLHPEMFGAKSVTRLDDDDEDEDGTDEGVRRIVRTKKVPKSSGASLEHLIKRSGFYLSTPSLLEEYEKNFGAYSAIADSCGEQFSPVDATAMGMVVRTSESRWWTNADLENLTVDGIPSKLVVDDVGEEDYAGQFGHATGFSFVKDESEKVAHIGDFWDLKNPEIPTLPVVRVFNLQSSEHTFVAASTIKPYAYDATIWEKLILPPQDMDFIHILLSSTTVNISDIVAGKARGIIVVCSGAPGLGKTLTAEASSEAFKKPFYSVQCSQLGIDPETLEKNLLLALRRAARWGAILLLDEADVYVRRRGADIQQNAIVGVFLRVLEYYRGVLFMTTNLGEDIDDAILSRATAHLHYNLPLKEQLPELWRVLSTQLTLSLSADDITRLVEHFGSIPGRSIRNLIKLAKYLVVSKKRKSTAEDVLSVAKYLNVVDLAKKDHEKTPA